MTQSWHAALPGFRYIPVISGDRPDGGRTGCRGLAHEAAPAGFGDLPRHGIYVRGAPPTIEAARECFTCERGLPAEVFHADVFTFAAVPAAQKDATRT
jgi:CDP-4-dehydro-6-deoxyglucose reductase